MANEITVVAQLQALKSYLNISQNVTLRADLTGNNFTAQSQSIGHAAHEAIVIGADVGTAGWAFFRNLDATNFVQIGVDVGGTFYPLAKLLPGETAGPLRLATTSVYAQADTAAVDLFYLILEA